MKGVSVGFAIGPLLLAIASAVCPAARAGDVPSGDAAVVAALPRAKHSLLDAVRAVAKAPAVAISAKLEDEGRGLTLSVYTAGRGLDVDAEHNVLQESAGDPTSSEWEPSSQTFEDAAHVARASEQLTLMRTTELTLSDVIRKAASLQGATVFSVTPALRDGRGVFLVRVAVTGEVVPLTLDLRTGDPVGGAWPPTPRPPLPTPLVGELMPELVVDGGRWIPSAPMPLRSAVSTRVVLIASNSYG